LSNFFNQMAMADSIIQSVASDGVITIQFQGGAPSVTVPLLWKNPVLEEDYQPGLPASMVNPVTNLLPWVKLNGTAAFPGILQLTVSADYPTGVPVQHGDTATVSGVVYDIHRVDVDREGGATLHLKVRT
jgi:hypothetical protein